MPRPPARGAINAANTATAINTRTSREKPASNADAAVCRIAWMTAMSAWRRVTWADRTLESGGVQVCQGYLCWAGWLVVGATSAGSCAVVTEKPMAMSQRSTAESASVDEREV